MDVTAKLTRSKELRYSIAYCALVNNVWNLLCSAARGTLPCTISREIIILRYALTMYNRCALQLQIIQMGQAIYYPDLLYYVTTQTASNASLEFLYSVFYFLFSSTQPHIIIYRSSENLSFKLTISLMFHYFLSPSGSFLTSK